MTCPQRRLPLRFVMMADIMFSLKAFGLVSGRELSVGISRHPPVGSFLHHLEIVLGSTPMCRDTLRIDHPRYFTSRTASLLTFGIYGFLVYGIYMDYIPWVLRRY